MLPNGRTAVTDAEESRPTPGPAEAGAGGDGSLTSHLTDIAGSLRRLAALEIGIWLTRTKLAIVRMVLFVMLLMLALLLAVIAVVFLYAGVYRVLTDVLSIPSHWALLIFAGVHFVFAGVLMLAALRMLRRGGKKKTSEVPS